MMSHSGSCIPINRYQRRETNPPAHRSNLMYQIWETIPTKLGTVTLVGVLLIRILVKRNRTNGAFLVSLIMLTLNPITLFFHARSQATTSHDPQANIAAWANRCNQAATGKQLNKAKTKAQAPSLSGGSRKTSGSDFPASSKRSALSNTVGVKIKEESGGLSDHDEAEGEEVEQARQSPVKKQRTHARSNVSTSVEVLQSPL